MEKIKKTQQIKETKIEQSHTVAKRYEFAGEYVTLNFTLNLENINELWEFKQLLENALDEVNDDIAKHG